MTLCDEVTAGLVNVYAKGCRVVEGKYGLEWLNSKSAGQVGLNPLSEEARKEACMV